MSIGVWLILENKYLIVPIKIQALYITNSNKDKYANTKWNKESLIIDPTGSLVETDEFTTIGGDSGKKLYKNGMYIYWIVPDAFTKGNIVEGSE